MFRFEHPEFLYALALLPVLALRIRAHLLSRRGAPGLVSPKLHARLFTGTAILWRWLRFALAALAFAAVVMALHDDDFIGALRPALNGDGVADQCRPGDAAAIGFNDAANRHHVEAIAAIRAHPAKF